MLLLFSFHTVADSENATPVFCSTSHHLYDLRAVVNVGLLSAYHSLPQIPDCNLSSDLSLCVAITIDTSTVFSQCVVYRVQGKERATMTVAVLFTCKVLGSRSATMLTWKVSSQASPR